MSRTRKVITLGDIRDADAILEARQIIRERRLQLREEERRAKRLTLKLSQFGGEIRELALANTLRKIEELRASI